MRSVEPDYRTNEVRYYESIGLLTERSGGNYPDYGKDDVERLRFIKAAKRLG